MHSKLTFAYLVSFTVILLSLTSCSSKKSQYAEMIMDSASYTSGPLNSHGILPQKGKVLTREQAVEIALANNPGIAISRLKSVAATAQYYGSFSSLSPSAAVDSHGNNLIVYADAKRWNAINTQMDILAKKESMISAREMSANTRRLLALQTAIAYDTVVMDKKEINIMLQNLTFYKTELQSLENRNIPSQLNNADVFQIKTRINEINSALIQSISKFNNDKTALAVLMGLPNAEMPKNIIFTEQTLSHHTDISNIDTYLDTAAQNRPDLKSARAQADAAEFNLYSSYSTLTPLTDAAASDKSISVSTRENLNPMPETFDIINAQAAKDISEEKLLQNYMQVQNSVRTSYYALSAAKSGENIISAQKDIAQENRDIIKARYDQGLADFNELNQAQNEYINTLLLYNKATIKEAVSRAALDASVGISGF